MEYTLKEVQEGVLKETYRDWKNKSLEEQKSMCLAGLCEEVGEVAGLIKREIRGLPKDLERATYDNFVDELGDVLWYLSALCNQMSISLDHVWEHNREKLEKRYGK